MLKAYTLTAIAGAVLLSGCSVAPSGLTLGQATQLGQESRASLFATKPVIESIDLQHAIARAMTHNRDRRVALMESVVANGRADLSKFDMLPELAANAGYSDRDRLAPSSSNVFENGAVTVSTPPTYSVSAGLTDETKSIAFSWNLLDFGLSYVRAGQNADRFLIAQETERKAIHNLVQDVRTSYWKALSAQRLLIQIEPLYAKVQSALANSRQIERERLTNPMEALAYQRDLLEIQRALQALQRDLTQARTSFATLIGLPGGAPFSLLDDASFAIPEVTVDVESLELAALGNRPELRSAHYEQRVAYAEAKAAVMRLLPGIGVTAGRYSDDNGYLLNNDWSSVGATLNLNLFNVFRAPAQRAAGNQAKALADEKILAATAAVLGQVHLAQIGFQQSKEQFRTASDYLDVVRRIRLTMASMKEAEQGGDLDLIREEFSEVLAELRRDVAYADVQNSYGRVFVTAGFDPIPSQVNDLSIDGLAAAISATEAQWDSGAVGLTTHPVSQQWSGVWHGAGEQVLTLAADTFALGGTLDYSAGLTNGAALPDWLRFDGSRQTFVANPSVRSAAVEVEVTARNQFGLTATDQFSIQLDKVNDAPVWNGPTQSDLVLDANAAADPLMEQGELAAQPSDADGDALTYTMAGRGFRGAPSWLRYDAVSNAVRFDPTRLSEVTAGRRVLHVVATDSAGTSAKHKVNIEVRALDEQSSVVAQ